MAVFEVTIDLQAIEPCHLINLCQQGIQLLIIQTGSCQIVAVGRAFGLETPLADTATLLQIGKPLLDIERFGNQPAD